MTAGPTTVAVRIALTSSRGLKKGLTAARALNSGFWLGVLSDASLDAATALYYDTDDHYLGDVYNRQGLSRWECEAIVLRCPAPARVLIPAAGGGRELLGLADLGYDAVGFDPSIRLTELGTRLIAETGSSATLVHAEPDTVPQTVEGPFDAVLFGWGGLSHVKGRSRREAMLGDLADLLRPGGIMALSFLPRAGMERRFTAAHRIGTTIRTLHKTGPLEVGDWFDGNYTHYFTFDELDDELSTAGIHVTDRIEESFPHVIGEKR